jgi:hypothetical protein
MGAVRNIEWFIDAIQKADTADGVLKVWREAEDHLEVDDLVRIHETCRDKIIHSIKEVKK